MFPCTLIGSLLHSQGLNNISKAMSNNPFAILILLWIVRVFYNRNRLYVYLKNGLYPSMLHLWRHSNAAVSNSKLNSPKQGKISLFSLTANSIKL